MELRNDLFFNKDVFTSIIQAENPASPFFVFGKVLGGQGGAIDQMFEPVTKGVGAEFIKIMEERDFAEHARIVDISRVPSTVKAGAPFDITLDRAIGDPDESGLLKNEVDMIRVESRRGGTLGTDYTIQMVGIPGKEYETANLFQVGDAIHFGYGNSKGQGSMNSNTLVDDLTKQTTFYNLMSIMRYAYPQTGSAMADMVYKVAMEKAMDGSGTNGEYRIDMPVKFMRKVLQSMENMIMYNPPNFNPVTKQIANRAAAGRFHERPYYAGLYWQLDQCPWKWRHSKGASLDESVQKLDFILQYAYNQTGSKQVLFAMAEGAGLEWLRQTILQGGLKKYGIQVYTKVEGGEKLKLGFEAEEYYTSHGRIVIYDINRAMNKWNEFEKTSYNGISHRKRSNDIYFIPSVVKTAGGNLKKPAHIYFKEGNGVSRAMVFGYQNGITGSETGMDGDALLNVQEDMIKKNMNNDRYRMDSTVDGREFHVLTQVCPYIDVRNVSKLTLF